MSEQEAVAIEVDPFNGQEPSFAEFSEFRKTGTVPPRFTAAPEVKTDEKPEVKTSEAPPKEEAKTAEAKEASETEQEKQERDEQGKFKAKEKEPLFSADQQKAFDRAFAKREAKLRREFDEQIAAQKSSSAQVTAPAKEPEKAASSEPAAPELPDITTFDGTAEQFQAALKEYPAKLKAYLDATRQYEEGVKTIQKKLSDSEAGVQKVHPEYKQSYSDLLADVESGDEPGLPHHVLRAIVEDADDPHQITFHLAENREEYRRFAQLNPVQAVREVLRLELKLQGEKPTAPKPAQEPKPRQTSAPAPPEPVGARATAKAFDANDESLSADDWAKKRWEQVHKR